jgi:hypothetical protein
MDAGRDKLRTVGPLLGAALAGSPWWATTLLLVMTCGPTWISGWLDAIDQLISFRSADPADHGIDRLHAGEENLPWRNDPSRFAPRRRGSL